MAPGLAAYGTNLASGELIVPVPLVPPRHGEMAEWEVARRPYQLVVGYPKGGDPPSEVSKFFNSFKVKLP